MKLYSSFTPNPRRVKIFLLEKNLNIDTVEVNPREADNLEDDFLRVNPRGLIPTLELDDGTVLDESVAICRYFEELYPKPNLLGGDTFERAQLDSYQRHMEFDGLLPLQDAFRNTAPVFAERGVPGLTNYKAIPELAERGKRRFQLFLDRLDKCLSKSEYIAGDRFTIVDITAFVTIDFARTIKISMPEDYQYIYRWYKKVSERPSIAN